MMCDYCGQKPATIYLTKVVNGNKMELHLCKQCAEKGDSEYFKDMSLASILANLPGAQPKQPAGIGQSVGCANCGFTLERFKREGRLGCEQCYRQFSSDLTPMIRKIHGCMQHTGKRPYSASPVEIPNERKSLSRLDELKQQLLQAIKDEDYERAVQLRDKIRALEKAGNGASR